MRKAAFSEYNKRKTAVTSNKAALWGLIMGQCSSGLQQVIKVEDGYDANGQNCWYMHSQRKPLLENALEYTLQDNVGSDLSQP